MVFHGKYRTVPYSLVLLINLPFVDLIDLIYQPQPHLSSLLFFSSLLLFSLFSARSSFLSLTEYRLLLVIRIFFNQPNNSFLLFLPFLCGWW